MWWLIHRKHRVVELYGAAFWTCVLWCECQARSCNEGRLLDDAIVAEDSRETVLHSGDVDEAVVVVRPLGDPEVARREACNEVCPGRNFLDDDAAQR